MIIIYEREREGVRITTITLVSPTIPFIFGKEKSLLPVHPPPYVPFRHHFVPNTLSLRRYADFLLAEVVC
jgi:hypothetical protein